VRTALERLDDIIEGTLTLARQGRRVGDTDPVDLGDLAAACWRAVDAGDASLEVGSLPTAEGDADRLRHLLENLFRNAVEHGSTSPQHAGDAVEHGSTGSQHAERSGDAVEHAGDAVTVSTGTLTDESGAVAGFYVDDDGPGIPPDRRDQVLEPGYTSSDDGTGLGLAIVRWIAEAHGWQVDVTDRPDGATGARFEFRGVETA
jgi:signal transduction histidine kinase